METRTVLLYGHSLLLGLVGDSLAHSPGLRLLRACDWAEAVPQLRGGAPDVLVFDLGGQGEGRVLPLLLANPHLLVIGLDGESNRALVLTGRLTEALTMRGIGEMVTGIGTEPSASAR